MRGIRELVLHPQPRRTVLFGAGASGKSTVIDAIAIAVDHERGTRNFGGSDRQNGADQPAVLVETAAGSAWRRHGTAAGRTETHIDLMRRVDRRTPAVVRVGVKRRKRRLPARTGGHPWWAAFDRAEEVLRDRGGGGISRRPERWSQSQNAVIGLFAAGVEALAEAYAEENPLLEQPLVMLVDNIDEALHPLHRQRIVPALCDAFPKLQLIATTNSPEILTTLHPEELIELEWTAPGITAEPQAQPKHARAEQG